MTGAPRSRSSTAAEALEATVARLAARRFVSREGERVVLSLKGYVVSMPGPPGVA